jgi:thymidylate synthase (FAD)
MFDFTSDIGHTDWMYDGTGPDNGDTLAEAAGRLCYKSWAPYEEGDTSLNSNVTKVRHGNKKYIKNILSSGHGSVLEHVNFTFLLVGVSRVLTHELVRHRAGCAFSQESLRFCRLDNLTLIAPGCDEPDANKLMESTAQVIRDTITKLNAMLLESEDDFAVKKQLTSYIRRIAPLGLSTNIMFTANARALRHIIAQRTSPHAEIEIRQVFAEVADIAARECPNIFQDMQTTVSIYGRTFDYPKV